MSQVQGKDEDQVHRRQEQEVEVNNWKQNKTLRDSIKGAKHPPCSQRQGKTNFWDLLWDTHWQTLELYSTLSSAGV